MASGFGSLESVEAEQIYLRCRWHWLTESSRLPHTQILGIESVTRIMTLVLTQEISTYMQFGGSVKTAA